MQVSQTLNGIMDNNYDDDIIVSGVAKGYFPAVIQNSAPTDGKDTREITIDLMPLEQSPGGEMPVNTGLYTRQANEKSVKVTVMLNGSEQTTNTTNY